MAESLHVVCPHCDAVNRLPAQRLTEAPKCGQCHQPLFLGTPVELSTARFRHHLAKSDLPLLVDFWATWCPPCKMMAPHFAQAARELEPQLRLVKIDTDAEPELGAQYAIRSIPTLALLHQGRELARQSGALGKPDILRWVRSHTQVGEHIP